MRRLIHACLGCLLPVAAAQAVMPALEVDNEAQLPPATVQALRSDFERWGQRVYAYLGDPPARPLRVRLSTRVPVGYYRGDTMYLPPDDHEEMLETWVHELAHHATGHDSSFFFKEGIAVATLEALFDQEDRLPQGWPNYGRSSDAWVALFAARNELLPLREYMQMPGYRGDSRDGDYRSWQCYLVGGSFVRWYLETQGVAAFRAAFAAERPAGDLAVLTQQWRAHIAAQPHQAFNVARQLPQRARYQYYAQRLSGP